MSALRTEEVALPREIAPRVIVPIGRIDAAALRAISYASGIASHVTILQLRQGDSALQARRHLRQLGVARGAEFVEVPEGRDVTDRIARTLDLLAAEDPDRRIAVVIPSVVPRRPWLLPLHLDSLRLKLRLLGRRNTAVVDVPYHV
ncbi:MAG: hypothetical protein E6H84_10865 [Chloroflexi bacterium]|nr:MAG: hypothetical protein E6H84_10865 [Chloroflexota bacterium]TMG71360.1 MAG: hypothetical protein E6H81_03960 [Chloroflexota bacterium]